LHAKYIAHVVSNIDMLQKCSFYGNRHVNTYTVETVTDVIV